MTKQELEDALDSLQETINRTVREREEDRAAIRDAAGYSLWALGNRKEWTKKHAAPIARAKEETK